MIRIILIDDEQSACDNLSYLLNKHIENTEILGVANTVDEGITLIEKNQPDLVFLDIEMPRKNGFELIRHFKSINFHIIFVTAYESYAIKAFETSALDYLLKPIDIDRLKNAFERFNTHKNRFKRNFEVFEKNIKHKTIEKIAVPHGNDYVFINTKSILCIEATSPYCIIKTKNDQLQTKEYLASKNITYYENLFKEDTFIRVHRSWVVNLNKVSYYSKKDNYLVLGDIKVPVSRGYKTLLEEILLTNSF